LPLLYSEIKTGRATFTERVTRPFFFGGSIVVVGLDGEGRLLVEPKKEEAAQNAQNAGET